MFRGSQYILFGYLNLYLMNCSTTYSFTPLSLFLLLCHLQNLFKDFSPFTLQLLSYWSSFSPFTAFCASYRSALAFCHVYHPSLYRSLRRVFSDNVLRLSYTSDLNDILHTEHCIWLLLFHINTGSSVFLESTNTSHQERD